MTLRKNRLAAVLALAFFVAEGRAAIIFVPEGFEELASEQTLWLEVSLYGHSLGLFQARVDLEHVQFVKPDAVIKAIKDNYNASPALERMLITNLIRKLSRNGHLSCSANGMATGCDYLETQNVAVIYDENNARINVFLSGEYLPGKKPVASYYDVTQGSNNALIHQQNINFVADNDYQTATVQGNGTLGVTENGFINADWNWLGQRYRGVSHHRVDLNNAYWRQDLRKQFYLQGGLMDARDIFSDSGGNISLNQLPMSRILGIRAGSTLSWLNKEQIAQGTPVALFLSQDARVDAYRAEQLLSSFYLKAGAQVLDTRNFPPGSYALTLRIYENNQLVRTQSVPYTNSGSLMPESPQWFLQLGKVEDGYGQISPDSQHVMQGGVRVPVTETLSVTTGGALFAHERYWENALDWSQGFDRSPINGVLTSRISYLFGTEGSHGNVQQLSYSDGFTLSFYRVALNAANCEATAHARYSYSGCASSTSMMMAFPLSPWFFTLGYAVNHYQGRYVYRSQLKNEDREFYLGAPWESVYMTRSRSRSWQAALSRTFSMGDINLNTSINTFIRDDSGWRGTDKGAFLSFNLAQIGKKNDTGRRSSASLGANWHFNPRGSDQAGYNLSYSLNQYDNTNREMGASLNGLNTDIVSVYGWGRASGASGSAGLTLSSSWDRQYQRNASSIGGSYSSSLAVDSHGFYWGSWGNGVPSSVIALGIAGGDEADDASRARVSVDSGGAIDVASSSRTLLTVPGFRPSIMSINESAQGTEGVSSEIRKGSGSNKVFMTPGRMLHREVELVSRYTWLGKITDEQRRPLNGGIALNAAVWTPLNNGGFLLETRRPVKTLYLMQAQRFWQCDLKVMAIRDVVRYVGDTTCQHIALANLPGEAQFQAKLLATRQDQGKDTIVKNAHNEKDKWLSSSQALLP